MAKMKQPRVKATVVKKPKTDWRRVRALYILEAGCSRAGVIGELRCLFAVKCVRYESIELHMVKLVSCDDVKSICGLSLSRQLTMDTF